MNKKDLLNIPSVSELLNEIKFENFHNENFLKFKIKEEIIILPITEIVSENDFFDYEAKYHNKSKEITPARISQSQTNEIHEHSKKIYQDLNLRGMCRIDFIISQNKPFVIEVNTIPGLSEKSIIPQQLKKAGYNLKEVFTICLEN